ncbi:hypothetical protein PROFUN_10649 [Planoprotostelium fungivorum]|uniref:RING-type domain-containing protein n=1 Tax=Planoprotostelium fungivorum TaxID=1890364 RepID=A0A2P6NCU1_9EUKA|nr:hypothetical protein PROFUN_10649 [Planoprotostelium fungivorum]
MEDHEFEFVNPPSDNLYCPICREIFEQPVITPECSHSFCSKCIYRIQNSTCPLCRHQVDSFSSIATEFHVTEKKAATLIPGYRSELDEHLKLCPYEMMKPLIEKMKKDSSDMKKTIKKLQEEILKLKTETHRARSLTPDLISHPHTPECSLIEERGKEEATSPNTDRKTTKLPARETEWDIESFQCAGTLGGHSRGVTCVLPWTEKNYLFTGSHDTTIRVWDLNDVEPDGVSERSVGIMRGHFYTVWALALSRDKKKLFSGSSDATIKCWNTDDFSCVWTCPAGNGKVYTLCVKDEYLLSAGADRAIKVWDIETLECKKVLTGHNDCIWHIVDGGADMIYTSSDDHTVKGWNMTITLGQRIVSIAVGCGFICLGSHDDCKIKVYGISGEYITEFVEHNWEVWQLLISDNYLFSGSFDHTIKVWDLDTFQCVKTLNGHKGYVHALSLSKKTLFSGSGDKTTKIWKRFPLDQQTTNNTI